MTIVEDVDSVADVEASVVATMPVPPTMANDERVVVVVVVDETIVAVVAVVARADSTPEGSVVTWAGMPLSRNDP